MVPVSLATGFPVYLDNQPAVPPSSPKVKRAFTQRVQPAMACTQLSTIELGPVLECRSKAQLWLTSLRMKESDLAGDIDCW
jgi:hypothetical protein